jgi:hypothetical protein
VWRSVTLKCEYSQDFASNRLVTCAGALSIGHALGCLLPQAAIVKKMNVTPTRIKFPHFGGFIFNRNINLAPG